MDVSNPIISTNQCSDHKDRIARLRLELRHKETECMNAIVGHKFAIIFSLVVGFIAGIWFDNIDLNQ